jgi:HKD family nuclease
MSLELHVQEVTNPAQFGARLDALLRSGDTEEVNIGVAWVRRSGMSALGPGFEALLARGGKLRITVGIDIQNTSQEGLEDLLGLSAAAGAGALEPFVYHNESNRTNTTFHPKIYVFIQRGEKVLLIVGSNNLTGAAATDNVEAALMYQGELGDQVVRDAMRILKSWRDPASPLVRALTPALLAELIANKYVLPERVLRTRSAVSGASPTRRRPLFGAVDRPGLPALALTAGGRATPAARPSRPAPPASGETVVLMRIRTARGTQTQLPVQVMTGPLAGVTELISIAGTHRGISAAHARGKVNTFKLEIPETEGMTEPVLRLTQTSAGVVYEVYDSDTPEGLLIRAALEEGLLSNPRTTHTTRADLRHATWYRFV